MSCSSANEYMTKLVGGTDAQIQNSINGQLAQVSSSYGAPQQGSMLSQFGGRSKHSRKHKRRRNSKKRSYKRKSRKMIRRRK